MVSKTLPTDLTYGPAEVEWIKSPFFCMTCGNRDCWQRRHEGSDYYMGSNVHCHTCKHVMHDVDEWPEWAEEVDAQP